MSKDKLLTLAVLCAGLLWTCSALSHGQRYRRARVRPSSANLESRVRMLEQRVSTMERLLAVKLTPSKLGDAPAEKTVEQWQRHVATTERRLEHSTRMARKGYLSQFELFEDQLSVLWAKRQLALAKSDAATAKTISLKIEVLEAERNLAKASAYLKLTRVNARYGIGSRGYGSQVAALKQAVDEANKQLQQAKAELEQHLKGVGQP